MDTVIEYAKGVLSNPMISKLLLEYYKMVETDLCNCALALVQCLDLELKTFESSMRSLSHLSMTARQAT